MQERRAQDIEAEVYNPPDIDDFDYLENNSNILIEVDCRKLGQNISV